jgi:hypothetical protein
MTQDFEVENMVFTLTVNDTGGWFSLRAVDHDKRLFMGPIHEGMSEELCDLASAVNKIEKEIAERCEHCDGAGWIEVEKMVRVAGEYQAYEPVGEKQQCEHCNPLGV